MLAWRIVLSYLVAHHRYPPGALGFSPASLILADAVFPLFFSGGCMLCGDSKGKNDDGESFMAGAIPGGSGGGTTWRIARENRRRGGGYLSTKRRAKAGRYAIELGAAGNRRRIANATGSGKNRMFIPTFSRDGCT